MVQSQALRYLLTLEAIPMKLRNLILPSLLALTLAACQPPSITGGSKDNDKDGDKNSSQTDSRLEKANALSTSASQGNVKVISLFDGPAGSDIVGLVVQPNGRAKEIAWANKDFTILFPIAIDAKGASLNEKALSEQNVVLSPAKLADKLVADDIGFTVGTQGPVITAFMDPNCIFCNRFYNDVMPLVKQGKVRVRYVMVGFLKPTSIPRSVAILANKDPAKALDRDEKNFDAAHEEGGAEPLKEANPEIEAKVAAYTALMGEAGPISTPTLVVCKAGQDVAIERGQPQDIKGFIESLDKNAKHELCSGK